MKNIPNPSIALYLKRTPSITSIVRSPQPISPKQILDINPKTRSYSNIIYSNKAQLQPFANSIIHRFSKEKMKKKEEDKEEKKLPPLEKYENFNKNDEQKSKRYDQIEQLIAKQKSFTSNYSPSILRMVSAKPEKQNYESQFLIIDELQSPASKELNEISILEDKLTILDNFGTGLSFRKKRQVSLNQKSNSQVSYQSLQHEEQKQQSQFFQNEFIRSSKRKSFSVSQKNSKVTAERMSPLSLRSSIFSPKQEKKILSKSNLDKINTQNEEAGSKYLLHDREYEISAQHSLNKEQIQKSLHDKKLQLQQQRGIVSIHVSPRSKLLAPEQSYMRAREQEQQMEFQKISNELGNLTKQKKTTQNRVHLWMNKIQASPQNQLNVIDKNK